MDVYQVCYITSVAISIRFSLEGFKKIGSSCYIFGNMPSTYREARSYCAKKGGHLAEINSQREYDVVEDHWRTLDKTSCDEQIKSWWLGLTDAAKEGSWVADISGQKPTFTMWNGSNSNH